MWENMAVAAIEIKMYWQKWQKWQKFYNVSTFFMIKHFLAMKIEWMSAKVLNTLLPFLVERYLRNPYQLIIR